MLIAERLGRRGVDTLWNPEGTRRGREITPRPEAIILHDAVTTRSWTAANIWKLLTHGREGLPGPLANASPARSGVIWLVADGRCNHNGYGAFDNDSFSVEVQCAGGLKDREEPWNPVQQDVTVELCQVLEEVYGDLPILGHKESDKGRKIDPFGIDMNVIRARINRPAIISPEEEDDVPTLYVHPDGHTYMLHGSRLSHVPYEDRATWAQLSERFGPPMRASRALLLNLAGRDTNPGGVWIP